jgi:hypothetical protein
LAHGDEVAEAHRAEVLIERLGALSGQVEAAFGHDADRQRVDLPGFEPRADDVEVVADLGSQEASAIWMRAVLPAQRKSTFVLPMAVSDRYRVAAEYGDAIRRASGDDLGPGGLPG